MPGKTWLFTLLGLCLTACAQERVSVGGLDGVVDLAKCVGDGTVCEMHSPLFFPPWRSIESPLVEPQVCVPSEGEPWHIAWRQPLTDLDCASLGECSARVVKVAGDGSVWIAALGERLLAKSAGWQTGIFLMHLDREGRTIAQRVVEVRQIQGEVSNEVALPGAQHALAITTDARGHVFMAVAWNERPDGVNDTKTTASLTEYDESAMQVGDSVALLGVSSSMQLGLAAGASLVLLAVESGASPGGGQGRSRMAAFDAALKPIWVQSLASPGVLPKSTLANGEHLALAGPGDASRPPPAAWFTLDQYDAQGNAVASLRAMSPVLPFSMDADGDVFLLDRPSDPALNLRKIGHKGDTLFSAKVARQGDPGAADELLPLAAVGANGKIYFLREDSGDVQDTLISRLVELSASGGECVISPVVDEDESESPSLFRATSSVSALFVTDSDEVYFQSQKLIARLKR